MKVGQSNISVKFKVKNTYLAYGSDKTTSTIKSEPFLKAEIPTTLFNTISLEYILKRNLTEILNGMLKKVSVVLGPEDLQSKPKERFESLSEIISFLPSILPNMTSRQLEEIIKTSETRNTNNERSLLRKTSNFLFNQVNGISSTNENIYGLDEGQIIVHDCKSYIFQCQHEGTI